MEKCLLRKNAKYTTATSAQIQGLLAVFPSRVIWQAMDPREPEPQVVLAMSSIQRKQKGKGPQLRLVHEGGFAVFAFDTDADRDMAIDCINKAQQPPTDGQAGAGASVGGAGGQRSPLPSKQEKQAWFAEDPDLKEEYEQLVVQGKVLLESEFWESKRAYRAAKQAAAAAAAGPSTSAAAAGAGAQPVAGRKAGISNQMLSMKVEQDDRMAAVGKNKLNFQLTNEVIAQIFAERPHVKQAYHSNVPHNMSEKEFWTRYTKHELGKEVRRKRLLAGGSVEDVPDEYATLFKAPGAGGGGGSRGSAALLAAASSQGREKRAKLARINPVINLLAHLHDGLGEGFGVAHGGNQNGLPAQSVSMADDLVRDINRHAEVVLGGVDAMAQAAAQKVSTPEASASAAAPEPTPDLSPRALAAMQREGGQALEDLRARPQENWEQLSIGDASRYFDRVSEAPGVAAGRASGRPSPSPPPSIDPRSALEELAAVDPNHLSPQPVESRLAYQVLLECSRGSGAASGDGPGAAPSRPPDEVLAPEMLSLLRKEVLAVNELCRHFWGSVPATNDAKAEKVERLHKAANERYDRVETMSKAAKGPERPVIRQLLRPMRDMLDALMDRYKQDVTARASQKRR